MRCVESKNCLCTFYTLGLVYHIIEQPLELARKYIDRKTKEHYKKLIRVGGTPKHVTETGPNMPEFEDVINAERSFRRKDFEIEVPVATELFDQKISELLNAAEETSDYIKNVNVHLENQRLRIDELKKLQQLFEKQVFEKTGFGQKSKTEQKKSTDST